MSSSDKRTLWIVIIISITFCWSFNRYLNHKENIAKIEAETELQNIIGSLKNNSSLKK